MPLPIKSDSSRESRAAAQSSNGLKPKVENVKKGFISQIIDAVKHFFKSLMSRSVEEKPQPAVGKRPKPSVELPRGPLARPEVRAALLAPEYREQFSTFAEYYKSMEAKIDKAAFDQDLLDFLKQVIDDERTKSGQPLESDKVALFRSLVQSRAKGEGVYAEALAAYLDANSVVGVTALKAIKGL